MQYEIGIKVVNALRSARVRVIHASGVYPSDDERVADIVERESGIAAAMKLLQEAMGSETIEGCGLEESVALIISQRDNARVAEDAYKEDIKYLVEALRTAVCQMDRLSEHIRSISTDNSEMDLARTVLNKFSKPKSRL